MSEKHSMPRSKAHQRLFNFLLQYQKGDSIDESVVCNGMGWAAKTLRTYEGKQMLAAFIARKKGEKSFTVVCDASELTLKEIQQSFSQSKPKPLILMAGEILEGAHSYELIEKLGAGAIGQVWRADFTEGTRTFSCAIKVLDPREDLLDPSILSNVKIRFVRESRNGRRLQHPNLVHYIDSGDFGRRPFIVMELAESSLRQELDENGTFDVSQTLDVVAQCV